MIKRELLHEINTLPLELQTQVSDYVAFLRQRYKIQPKNDESNLLNQSFLRPPEIELSTDFWDLPRPNVSEEQVLSVIRDERDED